MSHCKYCGKDMTNTSPRDSYRIRREDSTFCDDQCRIKYHNARRRYERKLKALAQINSDLFDLRRELQHDPGPLPTIDDDPNNLKDFFDSLVRPAKR